MNTIVAIGAAQAFFLSLLVLTRRKKALPEKLLGVFLWFLGGGFSLVYVSIAWEMPVLQIFLWNYSLLLAPAFFLYASTLMQENPSLPPRWFGHFIPYGLSFLYLIFLLISRPESEIDQIFLNRNLYTGPPVFTFFSLLELLVIPYYVGRILLKLNQHRRNIADTFSRLEGRALHWLKILTFGTLGIWLIINSFVFLSIRPYRISDENSLLYGFSTAVLFIFYIGYFGLKQTAIFTGSSKVQSSPKTIEPPNPGKGKEEIINPKYEKSSLKLEEIEALSIRLENLMENEKPYLQNDLTIHDLALALKVSTHHLSQVLNAHHQQTFFDYVNHYRVEEFKARVKNGANQQFTLLAIALDCGFNSKSSFNRIFKKKTGQTPGQFARTQVG